MRICWGARHKQSGMDTKTERSELSSLHQLVQDIIGGSARRHTFTQWELELLLDLQLCRVRKSARPEVLRRYLKAVHQHYAKGAMGPLRLSAFLEAENARSRGGAEAAVAAEMVSVEAGAPAA